MPDEVRSRAALPLLIGLTAALGLVHLQRGVFGNAQEEYKIAVSLASPPDPTDYFRLGEAYRSERKYDEAIEAFEKAAELAPGTLINQLANEQVDESTRITSCPWSWSRRSFPKGSGAAGWKWRRN